MRVGGTGLQPVFARLQAQTPNPKTHSRVGPLAAKNPRPPRTARAATWLRRTDPGLQTSVALVRRDTCGPHVEDRFAAVHAYRDAGSICPAGDRCRPTVG